MGGRGGGGREGGGGGGEGIDLVSGELEPSKSNDIHHLSSSIAMESNASQSLRNFQQ